MKNNMLSPVDIVHKEFSGSLFGFNKREVQDFLQELADLTESQQRKITNLEDKIRKLQQAPPEKDIQQTDTINLDNRQTFNQEMISKALILAEKTKDDIINNAKNEAKNIITSAEIEGKKKIEEAKHYLNILEHQFYNLKEQKKSFLLKFEAELTSLLKGIKEDSIFDDSKKSKEDKTSFPKKETVKTEKNEDEPTGKSKEK